MLDFERPSSRKSPALGADGARVGKTQAIGQVHVTFTFTLTRTFPGTRTRTLTFTRARLSQGERVGDSPRRRDGDQRLVKGVLPE